MFVPEGVPHRSAFVLFSYIQHMQISQINCQYINLFFSANVGATLAGILFFASNWPWNVIQPKYEDLEAAPKLASGLMFNSALSLGAYVIGLYEGTGEGARWDNFTKVR